MSELLPSRQNEGYEACDDEAEGLFPSGQYFRAASDYELLNSRAVRWKTTCGAAIPHPLRGSPLYTKGPLYLAVLRSMQRTPHDFLPHWAAPQWIPQTFFFPLSFFQRKEEKS